MAEKAVITKEMTFGEILQKYPQCSEIMLKRGMHCIGCGVAFYETIEQGAIAHGMSKKDINEMLEEMNKAVKEK